MQGQPATVLLVDDEEVVRLIATRVLRRAGFAVLTAGDGHSAIRECESHAGIIDLAILDCFLPASSGVMLVEALRKKHPRMRVLIMSGYPETVAKGAQPETVEANSMGFLQKPFTASKLMEAVRVELARPPLPYEDTTAQDGV